MQRWYMTDLLATGRMNMLSNELNRTCRRVLSCFLVDYHHHRLLLLHLLRHQRLHLFASTSSFARRVGLFFLLFTCLLALLRACTFFIPFNFSFEGFIPDNRKSANLQSSLPQILLSHSIAQSSISSSARTHTHTHLQPFRPPVSLVHWLTGCWILPSRFHKRMYHITITSPF